MHFRRSRLEQNSKHCKCGMGINNLGLTVDSREDIQDHTHFALKKTPFIPSGNTFICHFFLRRIGRVTSTEIRVICLPIPPVAPPLKYTARFSRNMSSNEVPNVSIKYLGKRIFLIDIQVFLVGQPTLGTRLSRKRKSSHERVWYPGC